MRLGIFPQGTVNKIKGQKVIWLHTVSVGEAQAASTLIKDLKRLYPDFRLVISTVTETGNRIAQKLVGPEDVAIYSPLDTSLVVRKVIGIINPKLFVIAETEIWPNLILNLKRNGVAIVLVNGRISAGSFRGYKIIRLFLKEILQGINLFCMQTEKDAQKIIELGADEDKVRVTGNMKFDLEKPENLNRKLDLGLTEEEKLFIAGSTHPGEEKTILQVYRELVKLHFNLRLLIAPRHIERTQEIERLISGLGFKPQKVSQLSSNERRTTNEERGILVLDTIGQLKGLYALADIVFVGGSLIPRGGQNPIEPAIFGKPILFGPHMFNFSNISELFLNKRAAIMVKDARQLKDTCNKLLNEPILRTELGQRAKELVQKNRGATLRNMEFIKRLIK